MVLPAPSADTDDTGPGGRDLAQAIEGALEKERGGATASAARVRLAGSVLLLVLLAVLGRAELSLWRFAFGVSVTHLVAATLFYLLVRRRIASHLAWLAALVDIAAVGVIQLEALAHVENSGAVAGSALGVFVLVIVLNAETMRPEAAWAAVGEAIALEAWIMRAAEFEPTSIIAGALVLVLAGAPSRRSSRRLLQLVRGLVQAQVTSTVDKRRTDALESSQQTIQQMLDEAKATNARLMTLQREKDNLTQVLVHDLRTPLSAVIGNVDWIREVLAAQGTHPQLEEAASDALQRAHRLTAMISDLLDMAKMEDGQLKPKRERVRVRHICEEVRLQATQTARGRTIAITSDCEATLEVEADRELLRRMLENLVSNALRFTSARVRIAAFERGGQVVFSVQNDGPPIETGSRARIFEKFQQAGTYRGGWGLGLYFCRLAVEVHGGTIAIADEAGWNVTFEFRLPGGTLVQAKAA